MSSIKLFFALVALLLNFTATVLANGNIAGGLNAITGREIGEANNMMALEKYNLMPREVSTVTVTVSACTSIPTFVPVVPNTTSIETSTSATTPPSSVVESTPTSSAFVGSTPTLSSESSTAPPPATSAIPPETETSTTSTSEASIVPPATTTAVSTSESVFPSPPSGSSSGTPTTPASSTTSVPPAPNTGDHVNHNIIVAIAGLALAAVAVY